MAYATVSDLEARFGAAEIEQLSDRDTPAQGSTVTAVVERALNDASGAIDARLGGRFALPIAAPSAELVRVACDIARYLMHDLAPPEHVRNGYTDAIKWLDKVAAGTLARIGADGAAVSPRSSGVAGAAAVAGYSRTATFGEDFAEAWAP